MFLGGPPPPRWWCAATRSSPCPGWSTAARLRTRRTALMSAQISEDGNTTSAPAERHASWSSGMASDAAHLEPGVPPAAHRGARLPRGQPRPVRARRRAGRECRAHDPALVVISSVNGHGYQDGLRVIDEAARRPELPPRPSSSAASSASPGPATTGASDRAARGRLRRRVRRRRPTVPSFAPSSPDCRRRRRRQRPGPGVGVTACLPTGPARRARRLRRVRPADGRRPARGPAADGLRRPAPDAGRAGRHQGADGGDRRHADPGQLHPGRRPRGGATRAPRGPAAQRLSDRHHAGATTRRCWTACADDGVPGAGAARLGRARSDIFPPLIAAGPRRDRGRPGLLLPALRAHPAGAIRCATGAVLPSCSPQLRDAAPSRTWRPSAAA